MNTLILWVVMCAGDVCNSFEPLTWSYTTEQEREQDFNECSIMINAYDQLEAVKESDCYVEE